MHGYISIENISFSRNCDVKTTKCEERQKRFYLGKVYFLRIATRIVCLTLILSYRDANHYNFCVFCTNFYHFYTTTTSLIRTTDSAKCAKENFLLFCTPFICLMALTVRLTQYDTQFLIG